MNRRVEWWLLGAGREGKGDLLVNQCKVSDKQDE